ncbi:MAG: hypothetical protein HC915_13530, partial [Anaerolineae bacterium]|nr:hypothetical protein [Anaerolineae bacterium]
MRLSLAPVANANLGEAAEAYVQARYAELVNLEGIDDATSPSGTLRRSYRAVGSPVVADGQIDMFFQLQAGTLVVLSSPVPTAPATRWVPTFQATTGHAAGAATA